MRCSCLLAPLPLPSVKKLDARAYWLDTPLMPCCCPAPCCSFLTINCNSKTSSEVHLLPADLRSSHGSRLSMAAGAAGAAAAPLAEPRLVQARQPGLEYFSEHNSGQLYLLSNARGALDYAVYR